MILRTGRRKWRTRYGVYNTRVSHGQDVSAVLAEILKSLWNHANLTSIFGRFMSKPTKHHIGVRCKTDIGTQIKWIFCQIYADFDFRGSNSNCHIVRVAYTGFLTLHTHFPTYKKHAFHTLLYTKIFPVLVEIFVSGGENKILSLRFQCNHEVRDLLYFLSGYFIYFWNNGVVRSIYLFEIFATYI